MHSLVSRPYKTIWVLFQLKMQLQLKCKVQQNARALCTTTNEQITLPLRESVCVFAVCRVCYVFVVFAVLCALPRINKQRKFANIMHMKFTKWPQRRGIYVSEGGRVGGKSFGRPNKFTQQNGGTHTHTHTRECSANSN